MPTGTVPDQPFRFTAEALAAAIKAAPADGEPTFRDALTKGLLLRRRGDSWKFYYRRKLPGNRLVVRHVADFYAGISIPGVRAQAEAVAASITTGADVVAKEAKAAERVRDGLAAMTWEQLHREHVTRNKIAASTATTQGYALKALAKYLPTFVGDLTESNWREQLTKFLSDWAAEERSPQTAKQYVKVISTLYGTWLWMHPSHSRPTVNVVREPTMVGPTKTMWADDVVRDGRLGTAEERVAFLKACRELRHKLGPITGVNFDAIEMLFLSGLRSEEVFSLRWEHVSDGWIIIPADKFKGRREFRKCITPMMQVVLDRRSEAKDGSPYVFTSRMRGRSEPKPIEDIRKAICKVNSTAGTDIMPHDLRRTYAEAAKACGFDKSLVSLLVGHAPSDITSGYVGWMGESIPGFAAKVEAKLVEPPKKPASNKKEAA